MGAELAGLIALLTLTWRFALAFAFRFALLTRHPWKALRIDGPLTSMSLIPLPGTLLTHI